MKPARSPRFQSDADRCSIAAISCGGFPNGLLGAEQDVRSKALKRKRMSLLNVARGSVSSRRSRGCHSEPGKRRRFFSVAFCFFFPVLFRAFGRACFLPAFFFLFFLAFAVQ